MKPLAFVAVLCLFIVAACGPAAVPLAEAPDTTAQDRAAIQGTVEPYTAAFNAGEFDAVVEFYDEQVIWMPVNAPAVAGRGAVRAAIDELAALGTPEILIVSDEIIVSGDIAFDRGNYRMTITPEDGDPTESSNKYLSVWRKLPDGSWKIARIMFSSNDPLPED